MDMRVMVAVYVGCLCCLALLALLSGYAGWLSSPTCLAMLSTLVTLDGHAYLLRRLCWLIKLVGYARWLSLLRMLAGYAG